MENLNLKINIKNGVLAANRIITKTHKSKLNQIINIRNWQKIERLKMSKVHKMFVCLFLISIWVILVHQGKLIGKEMVP